MVILWIILGLVGLVILISIGYFNRFAVLINRIENSMAQIDVQLKKRADLVPNLVETIKGYMKHEKSAIHEVTEARKALVSAKDISSRVKAGDSLTSALKTVFALAENYPNLKANEGFVELQHELAAIEDRIAYARQFYNDSVLGYDNLRSTFPGNTFAALFKKAETPYLKIPESERQPVKVKFE